MAVRRLYPEQPASFAYTAENAAWAKAQIAKYPEGRQQAAIIPLLWRAQEQAGGWLPEPAIRYVTDMLGMAHIRGLEIATFYTMFQLAPVGSRAHVQVCGTTPCMLRGSNELVEVCKRRIAPHQHELSSDGTLSWEEVECIGNCANAPVVQVGRNTYEDLTPSLLESVIDGYVLGKPPLPGSQIGRLASCPEGGQTTLTDPALYDGSTIGSWRERFAAAEDEPPIQSLSAAANVSAASPVPAVHPAALAAMANAGLVKELNERGSGKPLSVDELERMKVAAGLLGPRVGSGPLSGAAGGAGPQLLDKPRDGTGDDLELIWGVAKKIARKLNEMGIWHFDQIASWTSADVERFEAQLEGFKGRITRDKWIEQCQKLATGWRPESDAGEKPKG
jgi:NADH-quinone oxidoreductase subunit E